MIRMRKAIITLILLTLVVALSGISTAATAPKSKTGVYYEIFVRSFNDTNGDGIGDLKGVTAKLDYLKSLGVKGIWLMPITASPSYHGYDTTDYYKINPDYGTTADLKALVTAAHKKGIKVIMDLVVNHTSSQHPWFVDASTNPASKYRDYFVFATEDDDIDAQSAAGAGNAWHSAATGKYLGIFWSGMPDWNFNNKAVRTEMVKIGQYWLDPKVAGVDGYRLDAAKHIYEDFAEQNKTKANERGVAWWQEFRTGLNKVNKNAYLVGEIWDGPSVVAPYLNKALNSGFNFEIGKSIVENAKSGSDGGVGFILNRVHEYFKKQSGGTFVDAPFLTNHDQTRVMSELEGNVNKAKVAASMLLTLPGNPFVYYGEEIGMQGLKSDGDEALRTPFLWTAKKSKGQTTVMEGYGEQASGINVETQLKSSSSLLNHYKKMIGWRNADYTLSDGTIGEYTISDTTVAAWTRSANKKNTLVLHNLTSKTKTITINGSDNTMKFKKITKQTGTGAKVSGNKVTIPAYSTVLMSQ